MTNPAASADTGIGNALFVVRARAPSSLSALSLPTDPDGLPVAMAIEDWDHLFSAVTARLEQTIGTFAAQADANEGVGRAQAGMLECVGALRQLHATLACERERRHRLELDISDLRTALALAIVEMVERPAPSRPEHATNGAANGA